MGTPRSLTQMGNTIIKSPCLRLVTRNISCFIFLTSAAGVCMGIEAAVVSLYDAPSIFLMMKHKLVPFLKDHNHVRKDDVSH